MMNVDLFVPGRLCIFGEHSDWASEYKVVNKNIEKGRTIVATIDQGIYATCKKSDQIVFSMGDRHIKSRIEQSELEKEINNDEFYSCVIHSINHMIKCYDVGGIEIIITKMDLPMGIGLSSSSAACVLIIKAYNEIYHMDLKEKEIMELAYLSEREAGYKCGRMDHVCALNKKLIKMEFDHEISIEEIKNRNKLHFGFCKIKKKNTKKILEQLNTAYPNILSEKDRMIQQALGIDNKEIVESAIDYIENGDITNLGLLMNYAQELYDRKISYYLSSDLKEDNLHYIIHQKNIQELILGAKGVGAHGDGAVQFLVEDEEKQARLVKTLHQSGYDAYKLNIK